MTISRLFPLFLLAPFAAAPGPLRAADLVDPPMLRDHGAPDLLMVARPQTLPFTGQPAGYVYEVCPRPKDAKARRCPVPGQTVDLHACPAAADPVISPYGGVRLQLRQGQILRIRLVNCLPRAVDAKHADEDPLLKANPTNLHTHGLIVEPRRADDADDPFGDYIFVLDFPGDSHPPVHGGMPGPGDHARQFDIREPVVDYVIPISANHPDGLFWFHPHVHGLSLNQVSGGLAGIITVGSVHAYACDRGPACVPGQLLPHVRHLILKDAQVTSDFRVRFQENPGMCAAPDAASGNIGACAGANTTPGTTEDGDDGRWEFTVNGQTYPAIPVHASGEIWRIANASGSATYNLGLFAPGAGNPPLAFQVLAIDGVSLVLPPGATAEQIRTLLGGKMDPAACPGVPQANVPQPVCATGLRMMPSARAEIFIRGDAGMGEAVLRTVHRMTGKDGDDWPTIDLARVSFPAQAAPLSATPPAALNVAPEAARVIASGGVLAGAVTTRLGAAGSVPVEAVTGSATPAGRARLAHLQPAAGLNCAPLGASEVRQVLFGVPDNADFGLGYRRIAAADMGPPASADAVKIVPFDHAALPTVCVQLARGNRAVSETWRLVNLAGEDHNFHVHQTRFRVVSTPGDGETDLPPSVNDHPVLLDNVPVPHATGDACDGTVGPWIAGTCKPTVVTVSIPFHEIGDFVYHCHILEHEDGGMMAKITVVPHRR